MVEQAPHIGTLRERPLHASLKKWYSQPGDRSEVPVDGFVVDLVRKDLLIEVQTSGFSSMRRKANTLLDLGHRLRVVHPIPVDTWIVKADADGSFIERRLSPRHGRASDIFGELVSFPELLAVSGFEIEILLTVEEEHRRHTPGKARRRRGWRVIERRLMHVADSLLLTDPSSLVSLLPQGLPDPFTTAELARELGRPRRTAQQMAYCLRKTGSVIAVGKAGNAIEYRVA